MPRDNSTFNYHPKIVKADAVTEITLQLPEGFLRQTSYAIEGFAREQSPVEGASGEILAATLAADRTLRFRYHFSGEQEHALLLYGLENGERRFLAELRIFSLAPDLFSLHPYKGDFHLHSNRSDGQESPAQVAAFGRRIGLDFLAITDHEQYAPSLEAIAAFADVPIDLRIYPGEEVQLPANQKFHIVNFGGRSGVTELFSQPDFEQEVERIERQLADNLSPWDRRVHATSLWVYEKIRATGGLGILCHPYWITRNCFCIPETLLARQFSDQPFDALELISGYDLVDVEANFLQVARYQEERAKGRRIPVVGASDAHGCVGAERFGWYYTIVFSSSTDLADLVRGIRNLNSVAVEALPNATPRVHGPFRLVKYAAFLLREFFPAHAALCREEGDLMLAHLTGEKSAAERLRQLIGQTERLRRRYWGEE
jgi:hypothetical protein